MTGDLKLSSATASNMTTYVNDYSVGTMSTDGSTGQKETSWQNSKWTTQWGYFNLVPDLKSAIILKSVWVTGKGYTANTADTVTLDHISGFGKDSFDDVLFNMDVTRRIGGDAFAEIMREDDRIINLKPLDPSSIKIITDEKGVLKRYEQTVKTPAGVKTEVKFKPEEILHLSNNRLADQVHGISDIDAVEKVILANEENLDNTIKVMKRNAKPMIMFKLGTDDTAKINAFILKMDQAVNKGENIYVPDDQNSVNYEVVKVDVSPFILAWQDTLRNTFYRTIGLPQIVPGASGQGNESESKVIYLAFEQIVEREQRYLENQIWQQLQIKIQLTPPTSLSEQLQQDQAKDGGMQGLATKPAEVSV